MAGAAKPRPARTTPVPTTATVEPMAFRAVRREIFFMDPPVVLPIEKAASHMPPSPQRAASTIGGERPAPASGAKFRKFGAFPGFRAAPAYQTGGRRVGIGSAFLLWASLYGPIRYSPGDWPARSM